MIALLKGFVSDLTPESAVIDVNGVGYEITCSLNTLAELQNSFRGGIGATSKAEVPVQVHVYTHVREDQLQLFGFTTRTEKQMFTSLLKVNGVGPKMAVHILSGASVERILAMIEAEDVKALSKLPKVGKKTAEQMILALKGKLVTQTVEAPAEKGSGKSQQPLLGSHRDIHSALINLGFRPQDVEKAVSQMPQEIDLQEGIRQGLSALSGT